MNNRWNGTALQSDGIEIAGVVEKDTYMTEASYPSVYNRDLVSHVLFGDWNAHTVDRVLEHHKRRASVTLELRKDFPPENEGAMTVQLGALMQVDSSSGLSVSLVMPGQVVGERGARGDSSEGSQRRQ